MRMIGKRLLTVPLLAITALVLAPTLGHAVSGDAALTNILNTSPLWADSHGYHACNVVNVTTSAVSVTIELIDNGGNVLAEGNWTLAAGTSQELPESTGNGFARCRFTLRESAAAIRANMAVFLNTSSGYQMY